MQAMGQCAGVFLLTTSLMAGTTSAAQAPRAEQAPRAPRATGPQTPVPTEPSRIFDQNANSTRDQLTRLLRQYPPSLRQVLGLDPTLLANRDYLAPYAGLNDFLTLHPEIGHNPSYFVGEAAIQDMTPRNDSARVWEDAERSFGAFLAGAMVIGLFAWLVKTLIDYRRWNRISKVQAEVHTKLLDRFSSNEDLLAYIQTPAGRNFLESTPLPLDGGSRAINAPVGRILWSVQAGLVMLFAGLGLYNAIPETTVEGVTQPLSVISVLAISLGVGFIVSSAAAYVISQRLGLFAQSRTSPNQT